MADLTFDGRVAVVTGGGRGLGRSHALLLAARGAKVVVNDPGVSLTGSDRDAGPAEEVVNEIRAAGGEAVASTESVSTPEGGRAIIGAALDSFGRIDILVHSAGIVRRAALSEMTYEEFEDVLDVHLRGAFHVLRPAFPLMCEAGYGRVVMTGSVVGTYGNAKAGNYSVAKGGIHALSGIAAIEGGAHNVKSNAILPAAMTRMSEGLDTSAFPPMTPEMVSPLVGWLAHERCQVTGEMFISAAGRVARALIAETPGIYRPEWTVEEIALHADEFRRTDDLVSFAPAPSGFADHLAYSFAMSQSQPCAPEE